jgi:hypothetical protein
MEEAKRCLDEIKLCEEIRNFFLGEPKYRYNRVIAEFKSIFDTQICGVSCVMMPNLTFIRKGFPQMPKMRRSTHKGCLRCEFCCVSDYDHEVCVKCAKEVDEVEFAYHHTGCRRFRRLM